MLKTIKKLLPRSLKKSIKHLDAKVGPLLGQTRVFVSTWSEGKNFGDDYLAIAMSGYLKSNFKNLKVIETDLDLDYDMPLSPRDVAIVAGGGLWGPSGTGRLGDKLLATWMGTPARLVVANIGIESFDDASPGQLVDLLRKAELVSFRDETSWRIAREHLGDGRVHWFADNTYLDPIRVRRSPEEGLVCVNLCGPEQEEYRRKYPIDSVVDAVAALGGRGHRLSAVVFTYEGPRTDYPYCRRVDPACSPRFTTAPLETCEFFIGMHFHSVVLALQNEIPTLAINYSDKVRRVMHEYGLGAYCFEPEDADLHAKLRDALRAIDPAAMVETIRAGNRRARARLAGFEDALRDILKN